MGLPGGGGMWRCWEAGFCFSQGTDGGVYRWLFALLFGKAM